MAYDLLVCEIYNPEIHGNGSTEVHSHYLLFTRFQKSIDELNDILDDDLIENFMTYKKLDDVYEVCNFLKEQYKNLLNERNKKINHPLIRNYTEIIDKHNYFKPEIGEIIELPTGERVCILKTFWLRLIQRRWKNAYKKQREIIQYRSNPSNFMRYQMTGKWHDTIPTIQGLLYTE